MVRFQLLLVVFLFSNPLFASKPKPTTGLPQRNINVSLNQVSGNTSRTGLKCIGAGRANEGLRADWQAQLKTVQQEIGFEYIRMHGLLHDDMGVYMEDSKGNSIYNWQYIDQLYDFLLSIHIKPFVELGFMPSALASGSQTVFWWKGNITPPKSYDKWAKFIENLVRHFEERYGKQEVKTWYFEVWNEPDLKQFYSADFDEYCKLYTTTVKTIKNISSDYKVGGPASAVPFDFEIRFLEYCIKNNLPVDFIATHAYGVKWGFLDETGTQGTIIDSDLMAVYSRMKHSRELISNSKLPNLELHFTEWSSSYTPTDPIHDSYQQAPFILDKIKNAQEVVNSMSYWTFTDIFEEIGPRATPFHGGFGLINYQGIKKPAFYAFKYLSQLGSTEIKNSDNSSFVCKNSNGDIQILLWDFTINTPPDSVNDQVYYKLELPSVLKNVTHISVADVPAGKYLLSEYAIGYRKNDVYTFYMDMGSPSQINVAQENALKQMASGKADKQRVITVENGKPFTYSTEIYSNDVRFYVLTKL